MKPIEYDINIEEKQDIENFEKIEQEEEIKIDSKIEKKIKDTTETKKDVSLDKFINRGMLIECNGNSYRIMPIMIEDLDIFFDAMLYIPTEDVRLIDWGFNTLPRYKSLFDMVVEKYCLYNDKINVSPELQKTLCWGLEEIKMFMTNWVKVSE